jgi:glycosyltransferase involved in cell wall biosynthesis
MNENAFSNIGGEKIAYVSSYPPRECGIATFTQNLVNAVDHLHMFKEPLVIAVNEQETIYNYNRRRVKCEIRRDFTEDYIKAARYVNSSKAILVNLQHEFGLFGGEWGEYINLFLENVQRPIFTTLHTLSPSFELKAQTVLKNIADRSEIIITMTSTTLQLLKSYNIPCGKLKVIQHGCPTVPFVSSDIVKPSLGLKGRIVLSTFGLINRGKGIEYVIRALPKIVEKEPKIIYLIIGETHPEVRKFEGERYRKKLIRLVDDLNLNEHVRFHNRFLLKRELIKYLQATDIYLTPYIDPNQISSGTLVYAMGTGKAIISTPYLHAQEALAEGRGLLCKFKNPTSIAELIRQLLEDKELKKDMEQKVYSYSREFTWPKVAQKYAALFRRLAKA